MEVSGVRRTAHTLYVGSWANQMLRDHSQVLVVDLDRVAQREATDGSGPSWILPAGAELVNDFPTSIERLDRVHVGSPALRRLHHRSKRRQPGRTVVVDEGLGSYGGLLTRFEALRREGAQRWTAAARATARSSARAIARRQRWATYERSSQGWRVNGGVGQTFIAAAGPAIPSNDVVLLTQPWVDLGLVTEDDFRRFVERVAEQAAAAGLRLVVRPHPGERTSPIDGFPLLSNDAPAEVQPEIRGARLVIGETTTALLNLAAIFGVPGVRLAGPGAVARLSRDQRELLDTYLGTPVQTGALQSFMHRAQRWHEES